MLRFLSSIWLAHPVAAQFQGDGADAPDADATDPCQVEPDENDEVEAGTESSESRLSAEMFERCNGVLEPPPRDRGTRTRYRDNSVIPPGSVPEQPPE